jgi:hypothetical protein
MTNYEIKAREIVIKMQFQKEPLNFEQAKNCGRYLIHSILEELYEIAETTNGISDKIDYKVDEDRRYWLAVLIALNTL